MDEFLPKRPALFFDFVLPSGTENCFSNFWIAYSHGPTPPMAELHNWMARNTPKRPRETSLP
jgi:hypothetical protein